MKNKYILVFISIFLFFIGCQQFYLKLFDNGFGVFNLQSVGLPENLVSTRSGELIAGDKILGKYHSEYPNLGIISVRFHNQFRDSDDTLVFRLKEENSENWIYEAKYKTDQFLPGKLFPFGFPIIKDSEDKTYQFELESLRGASGNGIYLDKTLPNFIGVSFINKETISNNFPELTHFLIKKILNVISDKNNLINAAIFFSPLILFFFYIITAEVSYQFLTGIVFLSILIDILYISFISELYLVSVTIMWIFTVYRYKFETEISSTFSLLFLISSSIAFIGGNSLINEKTAVWAFLFLCVTTAQLMYNYRHPNLNYFTLPQFIKSVFTINIDETNKKNIFYKKILRSTLILAIIKLIYDTTRDIFNSYRIFWDFYPNISYPPGLFKFILIVFCILTILLFIIIYFRRIFLKNIFLTLLLVVIFQQLINNVISNLTIFQYRPTIYSVSPSKTSEAWVDISIQGRNFQNLPFVGKVYIDGTEQGEYVIKWTDGNVVVRTNPAITKSGNLCVQTLSKGLSNCEPFEYSFGKE